MRRMVNIIYYLLKNNVEYKHPNDLNEKCNISYRERKQIEEEKLTKKLEKKKKHSKKQEFQKVDFSPWKPNFLKLISIYLVVILEFF